MRELIFLTDSGTLVPGSLYLYTKPTFDLFFELWNVNGNGVEQNLDVLSDDWLLLKTWKISDEYDPSVRILQKSSWKLYQKPQSQHVSTYEVT